MADVRYWVVGGQAFGYTPHRQTDGKFYVFKYRYYKKTGRGETIKKRVFGKRKKARETAYHWYCQRKAVLEKLASTKPKKPEPTKAEIQQQKIAKCEAYIRRHTTRMKLTKTLIKKWERHKKAYQKKLQEQTEA